MPNRAKPLVFLLLALVACPESSEPTAPQPPEPIGAQLRQMEGTWAIAGCATSRLYRQGRIVQYQCFDAAGHFSWENRGTLTLEATSALDLAIANADLDATEPVNYQGGCSASDSQGSVTIWVEEQPVSFELDCVFEGIVDLYDQIQAIAFEVESCEGPFSKLESVEPGCRAY